MVFDLTGKTALVTGASGGIGGSIAKVLHDAGATVGLSGTRLPKLEEMAASLGGERTFVLQADLSSLDGAAALAESAEKAMGSVDILVNNAGLTRDTLAMRMKDEDWQAVIDVNLTAAFKLSRALMKGMMKRRWGRIISIASIIGATGNAGQANYAASKAGLIAMSKSFAQELASRGVTVNCIAPGYITTAMTEVLADGAMEKITNAIPMGRAGTPEYIAYAALYLASEQAAYVTGATLHVNGGMAML